MEFKKASTYIDTHSSSQIIMFNLRRRNFVCLVLLKDDKNVVVPFKRRLDLIRSILFWKRSFFQYCVLYSWCDDVETILDELFVIPAHNLITTSGGNLG